MNIIKTNSCDSRARPGYICARGELEVSCEPYKCVVVNATHPGSESIAAADQRWVF